MSKASLGTPSPDVEAKVEPSRSVLLVIDMQNDFVHPEGANLRFVLKRWANSSTNLPPDALSLVNSRVPAIQRVVSQARRIDVPVVWVQTVLTPETDARYWAEAGWEMCRRGSWGVEWFDGLGPENGDLVVEKRRHSGFHATDLDLQLRKLGRDTVIVMGTATHGCVEGTVRDAMSLDYWAVVLADCCGQADEAAHRQALVRISRLFGFVLDSDQLLDRWHFAAAPVAKAEVSAPH